MYSNDASVLLHFNKYKGADLNNVNVKREIDNLRLERGLTFIDKGVILAEKEMFTEANGMRPKRKKVRQSFWSLYEKHLFSILGL